MVEFVPKAEKTLTILTHTNLNPDSVHGYLEGWNGTMDKIVRRIIEKQQFF